MNRVGRAIWGALLMINTIPLGACVPEPLEGNEDGEDADVEEHSDPILNGVQSSSSAFPSVGALLHRHSCGFLGLKTCYTPICSGTLIKPNVVLTAAHCVDGMATNAVYFTTNLDANSTTSSTRARATHLAKHPLFAGGAAYDFALITLEWGLGAGTSLLPTPAEDVALYEGLPTKLVGYGYTETGDFGVQYNGNASITTVAPNTLYMSSANLGAAACDGDSGGPALITRAGAPGPNVVIGTVHGGPSNCLGNASYARVGSSLMWVHRYTILPCNSGLPCDQRCGDYRCDASHESYLTCPSDCAPPPPPCGDGVCSSGENCGSCPSDCGPCGGCLDAFVCAIE